MISIVVPIFNEGILIHRLHSEIYSVMELSGYRWEVIYVNDGSRDNSLDLLLEKLAQENNVVIANLSRNWGHQAAITAGLGLARGKAVVMMDGDLQDPPKIIPDLLKAWQNGAKVVVAQRISRADRGIRSILFPIFYRLLNLLSDYPIPLDAGIFGLLDRQPLDSILNMNECNRYLPGLRAWVGYKTSVVYYNRSNRAAGEPKQTFFNLLKYALDAIFSFSYKPLRLTLFLGVLTAVLLLFFALLIIVCRLFDIGLFGQPVVFGYTSTIVMILFLGSVQLIGIGILGEYIGRIYDEVKRRPLVLIDHVYRSEGAQK